MTVLSMQEAMKQDWFHNYGGGVYDYATEDGFFHLIINGKDVLEGLKAFTCCYHGDGVYEYITGDAKTHKGKVDLNKGDI